MNELAETMKKIGINSITEIRMSEIGRYTEELEKEGYFKRAVILNYDDKKYNITTPIRNCDVVQDELEKTLKELIYNFKNIKALVADFIVILFKKN